MPRKTWDNVPCRFWTQNTVNDRGNSEYRIFRDRMIRHAPINADRAGAQSQVFTFAHKSICYLDPQTHLYDLVLHTSLHRRNQITIDSVVRDLVYLNVFGVTLPAFRRPAVGLSTFDCINNDGILNRVHLGHAISRLIML